MKKIVWPNSKLMAINLSYDDALISQINNAVPALNRHNLKASFYLSMNSSTLITHRKDWVEISKQGHELGNHTINHCCSASKPNRGWVTPEQDLDVYSLSKIINEIIEANDLLTQLDGEVDRTFNPPCGDIIVDGKNYLPFIKPLFKGIKGFDDLPQNFIRFIMPVEGSNPTDLIRQVKLAETDNVQLLNFVFHGIGGDHLSLSKEAHSQLLEFLAMNKSKYWISTYLKIITFVNHVD